MNVKRARRLAEVQSKVVELGKAERAQRAHLLSELERQLASVDEIACDPGNGVSQVLLDACRRSATLKLAAAQEALDQADAELLAESKQGRLIERRAEDVGRSARASEERGALNDALEALVSRLVTRTI